MAVRFEMKAFGVLRRFFAGLGYKLLALLIAFLIWAGLLTGRTTYKDIEAPVDLGGVGTGMVVSGDIPESIPIRISGKGIEVIRVKEEDFAVNLRLDNFGPGKHVYTVSKDDVLYRGDRNVEVDGILGANEFEIEIQKRIAKSVPVRVQFEGRTRVGYYLGLPTVTPAETTFFGPETVINGLDYVTVTVDVTGIKNPIAAVRPVEPPLPGVTVIGAKEVEVRVNVEEGVMETYNNVPVEVHDGGKVVPGKTDPARVTVSLEGAKDRLDKIKTPEAFIDVSGSAGEEGEYPVDVSVDKRVSLLDVKPAYVRYMTSE
jgi:YbbR domain-containing protein